MRALCFRVLLSSSFKFSTLVDSKNMALISEKSLWLFKWKILLNIIGDLKSKLESSFYDIFLLILWSKRLCAKFCSASISFHHTIELQSFDVSDVIPAIVQNISLLIFFSIFLILWGKNLLQTFVVFFSSLWSYEVLNDEFLFCSST